MTLDQIIEDLGGAAEVAAKCGCGVSAISNWKQRGIPRARCFDLLALAKQKGKSLTLEQVQEAEAAIQATLRAVIAA